MLLLNLYAQGHEPAFSVLIPRSPYYAWIYLYRICAIPNSLCYRTALHCPRFASFPRFIPDAFDVTFYSCFHSQDLRKLPAFCNGHLHFVSLLVPILVSGIFLDTSHMLPRIPYRDMLPSVCLQCVSVVHFSLIR